MGKIKGDRTLDCCLLNREVPIAVEGEIFTLRVKGDLQGPIVKFSSTGGYCAPGSQIISLNQ